MTSYVLVINSGSSSMKYQLVDPAEGTAIASGLIERIGGEGAATHKSRGESLTFTGPIPDHGAALRIMQQLFVDSQLALADVELVAVGHRVVHGGAYFGDPVVVDDDVLQQIRDLSVLAPLHNPANADGIAQAMMVFPGIPQVAVFDTAFFLDLPAAAATYAVDRKVAAEQQIRRYGFHGTSHHYVSHLVPAVLGREVGELKTIVLHLGNGASASAVRFGSAVETSMGLTPLEGLVMGTRTGDIDPAVAFHLARVAGLGLDQIDELYHRRGGLKGLCGDNDMRVVEARAGDRDKAARLALDVYCHRVRKYVGAYHAVLGRLDAITFTAGVGEHSAVVRARSLAGLEPLGIRIDAERNAVPAKAARLISPDGGAGGGTGSASDGTPAVAGGSRVAVCVVPTDEELAIAEEVTELLERAPA